MEIRNHRLILGGIPASDLVKEFGSPLYAYEEDTVRVRSRAVAGLCAYRPYRPRYSMKANSNPHLVAIAFQEGLEIEAVSPGEAALALGVGVPPQKIHFFSAGMTRDEMAFARAKGIAVTVDTPEQIEAFGALTPGGSLSVRVNPGAGLGHHDHVTTGGPRTKFGIPVERAGEALEAARRAGVRITGLHMHVGSNFLEPGPFLELVDVLLAAAKGFPDLESVCVGGGLGVPYRPEQKSLDAAALGRALSERFAAFAKAYGRAVTLAVEPGRYPVCEAGVLLTRVSTIPKGTERTFAVTDSGFNHLIRPMLYEAYHPILHADAADVPPAGKVDVCGNICETGDVFQRDCPLPALKPGDVLAITHAGAYGFVMASTYNTRPLPAEVLVKDGKARIIRRAETPESLAARELDLAGMKASRA